MNSVVQQGQKNQALERKRRIRVFYCDAIHLSMSELIIYSYRTFQGEYAEQSPHRKQVSRAVGLSADTVARADHELMRCGLLDCNLRAQEPPQDLFRHKQKPDETRHWRHSLLSWSLFVRSLSCGLSPLSVAVWSYIVHCAETRWQPRYGLGASYLATILRANRAAVQRVLGQLEQSGLLVRRDGCYCPVISKDYSWLADRWDGAKNEAHRPTWQELPEGQEQVIPAPSYADTSAIPYAGDGKTHQDYGNDLRRWLQQEVGAADLLPEITSLPEWNTDPWQCKLDVSQILSRIYCPSQEVKIAALRAWIDDRRSTHGATP